MRTLLERRYGSSVYAILSTFSFPLFPFYFLRTFSPTSKAWACYRRTIPVFPFLFLDCDSEVSNFPYAPLFWVKGKINTHIPKKALFWSLLIIVSGWRDQQEASGLPSYRRQPSGSGSCLQYSIVHLILKYTKTTLVNKVICTFILLHIPAADSYR